MIGLNFALFLVAFSSMALNVDSQTGYEVKNPYSVYIKQDKAGTKAKLLRHPNIPPLDWLKNKFVNVSIHPVFIAIENVNEVKNELSISAVIEFIWNVAATGPNLPDSTFWVYNVAVAKAAETMWTPKIALRNGLNVDAWRNAMEKSPVDIMAPSMAWWRLFNKYRLSCTFRIYSYPYDTQLCSLNFMLMTDYNIVSLSSGLHFPICDQFYVPNPQWNLLGSRNYMKDYGYGVHEYIIEYVIVRKSQFHFLSVILPIILLAIAGICIFLVEPGSDEKMQISFTISLSFFVIFSNVVGSLPSNADIDSMPVLYWLLLSLFVISIIASIYAAILLRLIDYTQKDESVQVVFSMKKFMREVAGTKTNKIKSFEDSQSLDSDISARSSLLRKKLIEARRTLNRANNVGLIVYTLSVIITIIAIGIVYQIDITDYTPDYTKPNGGNGTFTLKGNVYYKPVSSFKLCYACVMDTTHNNLTCPEMLQLGTTKKT